MRQTCRLVTDLPNDNSHFPQSNRQNTNRGAAHFGNRLYNHKALASHCNTPRISGLLSFRNPGRETVFYALHLYFGFLINRLRELMPTLTVLLNRSLKISELNYIGYDVEEPLSGEEDTTTEPPDSPQNTTASAGADTTHNPATNEKQS
jgi:hypothetical protein